MSTPFESIKARHSRLEGMVATQSVEIKSELASQAHKDRGWLIQALDAATEQNEKLFRELGSLEAAVDQLGAQDRPQKKRKAKEKAE